MTIDSITTIPSGSRLYIDTNVWIYALEGFSGYVNSLQKLFSRIDTGELRAITSELTLAETLVKPMSQRNDTLAKTYIEALQTGEFLTLVPVSREILIEAARLRATHPSLKLPDAVHAASAISSQATFFISNDARLARLSAFQTIALEMA